SGPAPCAPTPGASSGPLTPTRSVPVPWAAAPMVAPTTRPTDPNGSAPTLSSPADAAIDAATVVVPAPAPRRACCTDAPSGFDVRHRTKRPRPVAVASSTAGASEPKPRNGDTVSAS